MDKNEYESMMKDVRKGIDYTRVFPLSVAALFAGYLIFGMAKLGCEKIKELEKPNSQLENVIENYKK